MWMAIYVRDPVSLFPSPLSLSLSLTHSTPLAAFFFFSFLPSLLHLPCSVFFVCFITDYQPLIHVHLDSCDNLITLLTCANLPLSTHTSFHLAMTAPPALGYPPGVSLAPTGA